MRIGVWNCYEEFNFPDKMFNPEAYAIGHALEAPLVELKRQIEEHGSSLSPFRIDSEDGWDAVIFLDYPIHSPDLPGKVSAKGIRTYLIVLESVLHNASNWNASNRAPFQKVFSWRTDEASEGKVVFSPIPQQMILEEVSVEWASRKFSCMVAGNKDSAHPASLYGERRRIIRWFEANRPLDFDLFGFGWETGEDLGPPWFSDLLKRLAVRWTKPYLSYRGKVSNKRKLLGQYKFVFCLENARGFPGYVTEKVFDALLARCVPIYWGAPDIDRFLPRECFIDMTTFDDLNDLYAYLEQMSETDYRNRLDAQQEFLSSQSAHEFSAQGFAVRIWNNIRTL